MLKNIFKSAKKLLKNPLVQLGIGAFLPGMLPASMGILRNPALVQAGIGLLGGDKPENVIRNLGITALLGGGSNILQGGTFGEGVKAQFATPTTITRNVGPQGRYTETVQSKNPIQKVIEEATKGTLGGEAGTGEAAGEGGGILDLIKSAPTKILEAAIENPIKAAEASLLLTAFLEGRNDPRLMDVNPNVILDRDRFRQELEDSPFQNATGGIAGYNTGGEKLTSIGINANTGEPSGLVTGPGTGKSDSIRFVSSEAKVPTDISNGEFIITKEATDKIGPENLYALQTAFDKDAETFEEGQERMAMV